MRRTILMGGFAADAEAARVLKTMRGEMEQRFPSFFHERPVLGDAEVWPPTEPFRLPLAEEIERQSGKCREAICALQKDALYLAELGRGGVLKGLWDLGEALSAGMEVEMEKIPIRQETIEICECLDVDPYYGDSGGAFLLVSEEVSALLDELRKKGVPAAVIGFTNAARARRIHCPGHIRYLDKPRAWL